MEGAEKLIQAIYTRFLLRDFVGKVIPGSISVFGLMSIVLGFNESVTILHGLTAFEIVVFASFAWITAIFLQSFGGGIKLFSYFPGEFHSSTANVNKFLRIATDDEKAQYERFVAIKEASGNTAISISFTLCIGVYSFLFDWISNHSIPLYILDFKRTGIFTASCALAIFYLYKMHKDHVERQYKYVESVINEFSISPEIRIE